jgi:hypothetical protein
MSIYKTIILPVVLYGCETWSLTLREDQVMWVFYQSTKRRYRRLIYYLYTCCYMFRSYDHHQGKYINI